MVDTKGGQSATPEWLDNEGLGYAGHNDLFDALTNQEVGFIVLADIDYEAQLSAVHPLLQRQKNTKQLLKDKIDEIDAFEAV